MAKHAQPISQILEDRRRLFTLLHALSAWEQVNLIVDRAMKLELSVSGREYAAFCCAISTIYYRPFTQSYFGKPLGIEIVPTEYETLHNDLAELRHKTAAHTDATPTPGPSGQPQNAVYLRQIPIGTKLKGEYSAGRHTLKRSSLGKVTLLTAGLSKKANYHTKKILERYKRARPSCVGDYMLNVENDSGPMWIKLDSPPELLTDDE